MVPGQDVVKHELAAYLGTIATCILTAVNEYRRIDPAQRAIHRKRTRANLINDQMVHELERSLTNDADVKFIRKAGDVRVAFRERYVLKLKHMSRQLLTRNVPTQRSLDFKTQNQDGQLTLVGMPSIVNLFAGYTWNDLETDIEGIYLVCPAGRTNIWSLRLTPDTGQVLLAHPASAEGIMAPRVVVPKKDVLHSSAEGEGA